MRETYRVTFVGGATLALSVSADDQAPLAQRAAEEWARQTGAPIDYAPSVASFEPTNDVARDVMPPPITH